MRIALTIILVLAIAAGGYYWYEGRDARYVRQVIDCMYTGSYEPVRSTMSQKSKDVFDDPNVKASLPQIGERLKLAYGEIETLEFKSEEPVNDVAHVQTFGEGVIRKTWSVTSSKGKFDLMVYVDKEGKLLGAVPGALTPI